MIRSVKVTLKFATEKKRRRIRALLEVYRAVVNFYIKSLWEVPGGFDTRTVNRLSKEGTRLGFTCKQIALKQALSIVVKTRKQAKKQHKWVSMPVFQGMAELASLNVVTIKDGCGTHFDLAVRLSTLHKYHRITIPTKRTKVFNKWMSKPGAKLKQSCALSEDHMILWIEVPDPSQRTVGKALGVDIGINKILVDSDGNKYGTEFKPLRDKILRKKQGSKAKHRALKERDYFLNRVVKQLPWNDLMLLGIENLKNLKKGKSKERGRAFRRAMAPWSYRQVITRIELLAQENGVRLVAVNPRNTSRTCPMCGMVSKDSRKGEDFACVGCGYTADADFVGACNILARTLLTLGSLKSPRPKKAG